MTAFDARLRAAVRALDEPLPLHRAYEAHQTVEAAYAARTSSAEGVSVLSAAGVAVTQHARGEAARRAGDLDVAEDCFALARRLGLPHVEPTTGASAPPDHTGSSRAGAATDLLSGIRPLVERYCRARLAGTHDVDADGVVQEVMVQVTARLPERDRQPVRLFAITVARRVLFDRLTGPSPDPTLDAALRDLPSRLRDVVVARVRLGLSAEEAADLLGTTPVAVRVAQHRAMVQLRRGLSP